MLVSSCRSWQVKWVLADAVVMDGDGMTFEGRLQNRLRGLRAEVEHADGDARRIQGGGTDRRFQLVELLLRRPTFAPDGCVAQEADEGRTLTQYVLEVARHRGDGGLAGRFGAEL